ncbi:TonB-dependent siderophore receptor [Pseudochelatococcus sp. B33]
MVAAALLATAAIAAGAVVTGRVASAQSAAQTSFNVPSGPLSRALTTFGRQAGLQVTYLAATTAGKTSPGISGPATAEQALARILQGTGLVYAFTNATTVAISQPRADAGSVAPDGSLALDTITVEGQGESAWGPVDGFVARRSATATKTDTPIVETPQSISVVTRAQVEAQGARRLEEALTYTPGVNVGSYGSNPEQDYVFLRGFQSPFLIDGTRQYRDYIVGAQFGVEPYGYERIEVLRGPSSVLYGQISPGGAVNLVSKRPTSEPRREVQMTGGYPGRAQAAFDLSGPIDASGQFLYRLTGLGRFAEGQMDFQDDDRLFIAPAFTWQPQEGTRLTFFGHYQRDRGALRPVPLPPYGTLFPNVNGKVPRARFLGEPDFDAFERDQVSVGYEFEHRFNEVWSFRQNLRYTYVDQLENFTLVDFNGSFLDDGRTVDRVGWHDVNRIGTLGIDNQVLAEFDTGPVSHKALFGLDYSRSRSDWKFASATMDPIDAFLPRYGLPLGPLVPGISELKTATQVGLYAQDQIALDRWRLTLGGRQDWAEGTTRDRLYGGSTTQKDDKFTGRVGLTYLFDSGFAPYASYSTSFEPEIGLDSQGNPFKPTTAQQYEVGIKYQPPGANSFIAVSAFDLKRQNILTRDPDAVVYAQIQTGEARVRGIEFEAKANLASGFDIIGAYTYLDSEITKSNNGDEGKPLFLTPRHQLALWGSYSLQGGPLAGLGLGVGVRYRGKMWGSSHEIEVPSYTVVDASVFWDFGKLNKEFEGLNLVISARNLLDKDYISTCSHWEGCFYGEGRTVLATLKYQW